MNMTLRSNDDALADVTIEPGDRRDYEALAAFHYRAAPPRIPTAVYCMVRRAPTVVGRFLNRPNETQTIGVLVRAMPVLACALRDHALRARYRHLHRLAAADMINREIRTISRVVIHPQWRGLGLAVRLVRHALAHLESRYTEALAAMGRVHPFFERAGMMRYERPPHPGHARLLDALDHVGLAPAQLASITRMRQRIAQLDEGAQRFIDHELRLWRRTSFRLPRAMVERASLDELLTSARDHVLVNPVYYLCDHGRWEL
jgi:GNAT superfamily N-acetyltransferase